MLDGYHMTLSLVIIQNIFVECLLCVRHFSEAGASSGSQILSALASPVDPRGLGRTAVVADKTKRQGTNHPVSSPVLNAIV